MSGLAPGAWCGRRRVGKVFVTGDVEFVGAVMGSAARGADRQWRGLRDVGPAGRTGKGRVPGRCIWLFVRRERKIGARPRLE